MSRTNRYFKSPTPIASVGLSNLVTFLANSRERSILPDRERPLPGTEARRIDRVRCSGATYGCLSQVLSAREIRLDALAT